MKWSTILFLLFLSSCLVFRKVHRLIDEGDTHYWESIEKNPRLRLNITAIDKDNHKFKGELLLDNDSSLMLRGYEKGNVHRTQVNSITKNDTIYLGEIKIITKGWKADTVLLLNNLDSIPNLPISMLMINKPLNPTKKKK